MAHSEVCPICRGKGKVKEGIVYDRDNLSEERACHGCGGSGWITVQDNDRIYYPKLHLEDKEK